MRGLRVRLPPMAFMSSMSFSEWSATPAWERLVGRGALVAVEQGERTNFVFDDPVGSEGGGDTFDVRADVRRWIQRTPVPFRIAAVDIREVGSIL